MPYIFCKTAFAGFGIEFKPVTAWDLLILRKWRNSLEINKQMLDQTHINSRSQIRWFESISNCDDQAHWVVWCKGQRTGHVNIRSNGSLAENKPVHGGYYIVNSSVRHPLLGIATILLYHDIIFNKIKASHIMDNVLSANKTARELNSLMGYEELDEHEGVIKIILKSSDYRTACMKFHRYFKDFRCQQIF
jgi:hypothetical protein